MNESNVRGILEEILLPPLTLYSIKVVRRKAYSLIEINLDNLGHPYGSVSIGDCEEVSRKLQSILDLKFPHENYTLQVSSAGAEREIQIPNDLERFKDLPLKLHFIDEEGLEKVELVKFVSRKEADLIEFRSYSRKGKSKKERLSKTFFISLKDIKKGNLYLDY